MAPIMVNKTIFECWVIWVISNPKPAATKAPVTINHLRSTLSAKRKNSSGAIGETNAMVA